MGRDHDGTLPTCGAERRNEPGLHRDELRQPQRERVRGVLRLPAVVRQLDARDQEQVVERASPLTLIEDRLEIRVPGVLSEGVSKSEPVRVVRGHDVVRDAEDVEAVATVEIDQLSKREAAVAPGRVRVQLTEERSCLHAVTMAVRSVIVG
jgi:hypothetical protein